jgi:uncharacterized membrane protein
VNKQELTFTLAEKLNGLPWEEVERSMEYYDEMINEHMEEGMSEAEAIAALGSVDEIAAQILADIPLSRIVRAKIKPKRSLRAWEIILLILGFPLWFSLLIGGFSVVLSLFASFWAVVLSLYAFDLAFAASAVACLPLSILLFCSGEPLLGLFGLGATLIMGGLTIGWFFLCKYTTKGLWWLCKQTMLGIKSLFIRKEDKS